MSEEDLPVQALATIDFSTFWEDELKFETELADLLGGIFDFPLSSGAVADVLIPGFGVRADTIVEVKKYTNPTTLSAIGSTPVLSQTVRIRTNTRSDTIIVGFFVIQWQPTTEGEVPEFTRSQGEQFVEALLRKSDQSDTGFDVLVMGPPNYNDDWMYASHTQPEISFESFEWCLQYIKSLSRDHSGRIIVSRRDAVRDESDPSLEVEGLGSHDRKSETGDLAEKASAEAEKASDESSQPHVLLRGAVEVAQCPKILLVNDEWSSKTGGVSTINREMAIAFAKAGCPVAVYVANATHSDIDDAAANKILLVPPGSVPGLASDVLLATQPLLESFGDPDFIIGHGRVTGPYAHIIKSSYYPSSKRIHVVHTDSERIEAVKESVAGKSTMTVADDRRQTEISLSLSADLVVGIGQRLSRYISDQLIGKLNHPKVVTLIPGFDAGTVNDEPLKVPLQHQVLFIGRAEDYMSKGVDIAIGATDWIARRNRKSNSLTIPSLVIRGVNFEDEQKLAKRIAMNPRILVQPYLRPYTTNSVSVQGDFRSSRVVIMPSREEGFGLSGHEAIASRVPVLITKESGLADLLKDTHYYDLCTISTLHDKNKTLYAKWGKEIAKRLEEPEKYYSIANGLADEMQSRYTWKIATQMLLDEMNEL